MDYKGLFKEKLSKLLFLEIDWEKFKVDLKIPQNIKLKSKEIYIPISSKYVTNNANDEIKKAKESIAERQESIQIVNAAFGKLKVELSKLEDIKQPSLEEQLAENQEYQSMLLELNKKDRQKEITNTYIDTLGDWGG